MRRVLFRALLLASITTPLPAFAQAGTAVPVAEEQQDDAIVVTARRREESLQDVPLPVSVFSEKQLTSTGTYNIARVAQIQPVIQFYASNPRNSAINIRGLGAPLGLTNDGIEQGVGLYIDQVFYSRPASAAFDFIDTEQVEVLRGPQGTLYGKNTTAGAINIRTRAPSFTPEARAELSGGNFDFFQGKASVSGPITDNLAIRLGASVTTRRGTVFNVRSNKWTNSQDNTGFRGSLLYTGIDNLKLTLSGDFAAQNPEGYTQVVVRTFPTLRNASRQIGALFTALNYRLPSTNAFDRITDIDADLQSKQYLGGTSLVAELEIGDNTLTSVSAWRFWTWRPKNDRDFIGLPITTLSQNASDQRQLTQEFRFATSGRNKVDFVAGVFGYRQTIATDSRTAQGAAANLFANGLPNPDTPANRATQASVLDGLLQRALINYENNSLAAYGQLTWNVTDKLRIQPGIRFNYDTKDAVYSAVQTGGIANPTAAQQAQKNASLPAQAYTARFSGFNVSGDINISWRPVEDILLYGVYSRSAKSGGINLNGLPFLADGVTVATALAQVKPEQVDHFEGGVKAQFWDRKVTVNLTAYHTKIKDYQTTVSNGAIGIVRGYLANADVRIQGVEGELSIRPTERFTGYLNFAYNDGIFSRFADAPIPVECTGVTAATSALPGICQGTIAGFKDISGAQFPGVSKWSLAWGGEFNLPVGGNEAQLYVGADASYRSSYSSIATPSPFFVVDGYSIANFRAGYRNGNNWNIFGWVKNALKANYLEFLSNQPGNNGLVVGQLGDPRTYGLTVSKKF